MSETQKTYPYETRSNVRLHVPVISHCPLLQPVADLLRRRISAMNVQDPRITYIGNVNARALRTGSAVAH
jgi:malonate decarboxylase epsilon subunit